jgi:CopG family nickel-responsive transcriptional regulator
LRRRFGVSIPEDLASELDDVSRECGVDRSSVVASALGNYIASIKHYKKRHNCLGVCLAITKGELGLSLEEFKDVIISYQHSHTDNTCVNIFLLRGDSEKILKLYYKLEKNCLRTILVPLH